MKEKTKINKKSARKNKNDENAITLVALVVTIIVLIILAGISISLILGDNGIITKAREAKENYVKATENEGTSLNELYAEVNEKISGQDGIPTINLIMYDGTSFSLEDYVGMTWYEFASAIDYGECIVSYPSLNFEEDLKTLILRKYEENGDTGTINWVLKRVEYSVATFGAICTEPDGFSPDQACNSKIVSGQEYYLISWC